MYSLFINTCNKTVMVVITVFFFKQKTAYEIYQCDWSSDVCSSDLPLVRLAVLERLLHHLEVGRAVPSLAGDGVDDRALAGPGRGRPAGDHDAASPKLGRRVDRLLDGVDGESTIGLVGRGEPVAPAGTHAALVHGDR